MLWYILGIVRKRTKDILNKGMLNRFLFGYHRFIADFPNFILRNDMYNTLSAVSYIVVVAQK